MIFDISFENISKENLGRILYEVVEDENCYIYFIKYFDGINTKLFHVSKVFS